MYIVNSLNNPPSFTMYHINTGMPRIAYAKVNTFPSVVTGTISPYPRKKHSNFSFNKVKEIWRKGVFNA